MRWIFLLALFPLCPAFSQQPDPPPRCEVIPLPHHQASFRIDGVEKTRWRWGEDAPRPFFYPFNGPSGGSLTRMGHPGAPNHDHHLSVWFAHNDVNGLTYWANGKSTRIRQQQWLGYGDSDQEALMASTANWIDDKSQAVMRQETIAALIPLDRNEHVH